MNDRILQTLLLGGMFAVLGCDGRGLVPPTSCASQPGTMPRVDQGCVPVGIAGCASVLVGDDGVCRPSMDRCPEGTFAVPQVGCVPLDPDGGCGAGTWGNIDVSRPLIHVDASYQGSDSDGTESHPHPSLAAAVAQSAPGDHLAIAAGTYELPLVLTKPIVREGRCASMVRIQGIQGASGPLPAVAVGGAGVTLRNVGIGGPAVGIWAKDAPGLTVEGVHVIEASILGILVQGETSDVSISRSLIEDTLPFSEDGTRGMGIGVYEGARVTLVDSAIVSNRAAGLVATKPSTEVVIDGSLIEGTLPQEDEGTFGFGVALYDGASLVMSSALVRDHRVAGIYVEGATATLSGIGVDGVQGGKLKAAGAAGSGSLGDGLLAVHGSAVTLDGGYIRACERAGALFHDSSGDVAHLFSTENRFGLVLQGSPVPEHEDRDNLLSGNSERDLLENGDLPVPAP